MIVVVRKTGDQVKIRPCVDFRKLNAQTVPVAYPMPDLFEMINKAGGSDYFSSLDLTSAYNQIRMEESSIEKTGFITQFGTFEYLRMPFGLRNAPAIFQKAMNKMLIGRTDNFTSAYLDDILVFSKNGLDEHLDKLQQVLDLIREKKFKLNPAKTFFLKKKVKYLGFEIDGHSIRPSEDKLKVVKDYPAPRTPKQVKQYLGLMSFFRKHIPSFADIAFPLTRLLQKNVKFKWTEEHQAAFEKLKEILLEKAELAYPDFKSEEPFKVYVDASDRALGAVLTQVQEDPKTKEKVELPISFQSRTLSRIERRYEIYRKELSAVVYACKTFQHYILGHRTQVFTDNLPIKYLFEGKKIKPVYQRMALYLSQFELELYHIKGVENTAADSLSRLILKNGKLKYIPEADERTKYLSYEEFVEQYKANRIRRCEDTSSTDSEEEQINSFYVKPKSGKKSKYLSYEEFAEQYTAKEIKAKDENGKEAQQINNLDVEFKLVSGNKALERIFQRFKEIRDKIKRFKEISKEDKEYKLAEETLIRMQLDCDAVESKGVEIVRKDRKGLIGAIEEGFELLESKLQQKHHKSEESDEKISVSKDSGIQTEVETNESDCLSSAESQIVEKVLNNSVGDSEEDINEHEMEAKHIIDEEVSSLSESSTEDGYSEETSSEGEVYDRESEAKHVDEETSPSAYERTTVADEDVISDTEISENSEKSPSEGEYDVLVAEEQMEIWKKDKFISRQKVKEEQLKDPTLASIIADLKSNEKSKFKESFTLDEDSVLYRTSTKDQSVRICIPSQMETEVIKSYHESVFTGHPGIKKTIELMKDKVYIKGLQSKVRKVVSQCRNCLQTKPCNRPMVPPMKLYEVEARPFNIVNMDFMGPINSLYGTEYKYALIIVDRFSSWVEIIPTKDMRAETVSNIIMEQIIPNYGIIPRIVSDNQTTFHAEEFRNFCEKMDIRVDYTTAYSPQSNGKAELFVKNTKKVLASLIADYPAVDWTKFLPYVKTSLRSSVNEASKMSPFEIVYNRKMILPHEAQLKFSRYRISDEECVDYGIALWKATWNKVKENIEEYQTRTKNRFDKKAKDHDLRIGQTVYIKRKAFDPKESKLYQKKYLGPFKIKKLTETNATLEPEDGNNKPCTVHIRRIKPVQRNVESEIELSSDEEEIPEEIEKEIEMEPVKEIQEATARPEAVALASKPAEKRVRDSLDITEEIAFAPEKQNQATKKAAMESEAIKSIAEPAAERLEKDITLPEEEGPIIITTEALVHDPPTRWPEDELYVPLEMEEDSRRRKAPQAAESEAKEVVTKEAPQGPKKRGRPPKPKRKRDSETEQSGEKVVRKRGRPRKATVIPTAPSAAEDEEEEARQVPIEEVEEEDNNQPRINFENVPLQSKAPAKRGRPPKASKAPKKSTTKQPYKVDKESLKKITKQPKRAIATERTKAEKRPNESEGNDDRDPKKTKRETPRRSSATTAKERIKAIEKRFSSLLEKPIFQED